MSHCLGVVVNGAIMMREYFTKDLSSALGITNVLRSQKSTDDDLDQTIVKLPFLVLII